MSEDLVRMQHIDKFYGRVQALDDVNFTVARQEIVGLLGDNGAGKSTLIKVLSGAVRASSGDIIVRGKRADIRSTTDAIALGIETIYQDWRLSLSFRSREISFSAANRSRARASSIVWTRR